MEDLNEAVNRNICVCRIIRDILMRKIANTYIIPNYNQNNNNNNHNKYILWAS